MTSLLVSLSTDMNLGFWYEIHVWNTTEQAVEMALKAHPGKVTKAYEDTKKGKKTWEVKIKGDDGKKWEVYYEIATGQLVAEEED